MCQSQNRRANRVGMEAVTPLGEMESYIYRSKLNVLGKVPNCCGQLAQ